MRHSVGVDAPGLLTATCRVAAVLAIAGLLAMHVLTTGHHADLPGTGGHSAVMGSSVMAGAPVATAPEGPTLPEKLVGVCMAVLLVAATTLLLLLFRTRRRRCPWSTASGGPVRWALHVPSPRAPCLFTLGVLRT